MGTFLQAPTAAARLAQARTWLKARHPAERTLMVVPSALAGARLCQPLLHPGRARFGLQRMTLGELALRLATPRLASHGLAPADGAAQRALIARALAALDARGALGRFASVRERPGLPRALERTLDELSRAAIEPAALAAHDPDLATLLEAYRGELAGADLVDRGGLLRHAAEAARDGHELVGLPSLWLDVPLRHALEAELLATLSRAAPDTLCTVPSGDLRTAELLEPHLKRTEMGRDATLWDDALVRLQSHLFEPVAPRGSLGSAVTVLSAPGEGRECVEVARRLLLAAQAGTPFDRMAVVTRNAASYQHLLAEALARAGVPAHFTRGSTRPHPGGRALLALLSCKREGLSARAFTEYLSLSVAPATIADAPAASETWQVPDAARRGEGLAEADDAEEEASDRPETVARASARRWERLLDDAAVVGGAARWHRRLQALAHQLDLEVAALQRDEGESDDGAGHARLRRDREELAQLRAVALPLIDTLDAMPEQATWGQWLQALDALAVRALAPRHVPPVQAALAELAPLAPLGPVSIDEVSRVLAPLLGELRTPPRGAAAGRVLCGDVESLRGLEFDLVCVLGLAEKIFPQKVVEDPVLLDASRERIDPGLTRNPQRIAQERLALRLAVGAARRRVILSYPRIDLERGRPRVPSFYGLEVLRAAEGELPGYDELMRRAEAASAARIGWPAPAQPELAIDEAEHDLALLHEILRKDAAQTRGAARYLLQVNPHLARSLRFRARRWSVRGFTPADGVVKPSAAALAVLQRHRLAARAHSPTALETYASCPYRFALRALHGLRPRPSTTPLEQIDPRQRGALFHDAQYATLSALRDAGLLPLTRQHLPEARAVLERVTAEVAAGHRDRLAPAIERVWNDSVAEIGRDLNAWLQRMPDDALQPAHFELAFGLRPGTGHDPASREAPVALEDGTLLRGSIDVVDLDRGELRATDHKTGKAIAPDGLVIDGGRTLQPVLYALALERLMPGQRVVGGRLYYCTGRGEFAQREVELSDRARAAAGRALRVIDGALASGFLPAAPEPDACEHCDYLPVCGPYEEMRLERKDGKALAPLHALREEP